MTRPVQDDDSSQLVIHLNSAQLVPFFNAGGIPVGRQVTVTGTLAGIQSTYTNKETGEIVPFKRTRIRMGEAIVQWGPKPTKK